MDALATDFWKSIHDSKKTADWHLLFKLGDTIGKCDDGYVSEGISDSISYGLAERWDQAGPVFEKMNGSSKFRAFVLEHLDETVPDTVGELIARNASTKCPKGQSALCKKIREKASAVPALLPEQKEKVSPYGFR